MVAVIGFWVLPERVAPIPEHYIPPEPDTTLVTTTTSAVIVPPAPLRLFSQVMSMANIAVCFIRPPHSQAT
jgi:hypothetical protein